MDETNPIPPTPEALGEALTLSREILEDVELSRIPWRRSPSRRPGCQIAE
jgi:hypothetical protein